MNSFRIKPGHRVNLAAHDPADTGHVSKQEAEAKLPYYRQRLEDLQEVLYAAHDKKVLIILQGLDSSGKDGTIRHVMNAFNPQGVRVASFKKPTERELDHDFLWRAHAQVPGKGEIVIFNRSHYEDVLIVRVHKLVQGDVWEERFRQINDFERLLTATGTLLVKFCFHIGKDEQKKRLEARIASPTKRWKFQHSDVEERKYWQDYQRAFEDMLEHTSTDYAPWYLIPADHKWYRNYLVGCILTEEMEKLGLTYPAPDLRGVKIE